MLRLIETTTPSGPALRVEGRLTAPDAVLVRRACQSKRICALELSWLTFADEAGAVVLDDLRRRGARLLHVPPFVTALLEKGLAVTPTSHPPTPPDARVPSTNVVVDIEVDADIISALRAGGDDAFEQLVRTHAGRLLAVARQLLRDPRDAEEAVQEAFTSAFRAVKTFRGECRLSTWLHCIVVNHALMKLRTRRRRPELAIDALLPSFSADGHRLEQADTLDPEQLLTAAETRQVVRGAIDRLPDAYRTVLLLRDIEELDTPTVAGLLGISSNAVKIRLHRARQALVTLLAPSAARTTPAVSRRRAAAATAP